MWLLLLFDYYNKRRTMSASRAPKCWTASSLRCCSRSRSRSRSDTDSDCCTTFSRSRRLAIIRSCLSIEPRSPAPCLYTSNGSDISWCQLRWQLTNNLDLDLGCIGPHSDAILICYQLSPPLPSRWFPSLTSPCWLCSSSLYADDPDLS